jgi:hypothetical protein
MTVERAALLLGLLACSACDRRTLVALPRFGSEGVMAAPPVLLEVHFAHPVSEAEAGTIVHVDPGDLFERWTSSGCVQWNQGRDECWVSAECVEPWLTYTPGMEYRVFTSGSAEPIGRFRTREASAAPLALETSPEWRTALSEEGLRRITIQVHYEGGECTTRYLLEGRGTRLGG